jgi:hypothetical protein
MHADLLKASEILALSLPHLNAVAERTEETLLGFKSIISEKWERFAPSNPQTDIRNVDLVLLGSLARQEMTEESDCDYLLIQNGCTPDISQGLLSIADKTRRELNLTGPGQQGGFGEIAIAANLYERIGLENDTNQNLTHRMLFLIESVSAFSSFTHEDVTNKILQRYCADYLPPRRENGPAKVPRHLVNDLVRFWRTMAVDFGAKRWRSMEEDLKLRLTKLRTTRKMLFAGPLCSLLLVPERIRTAQELPDYLRLWLKKPPVAQLASIVSDETIAPKLSDHSKDALKQILEAYDSLLGLFSERGTRNALRNLNSAAKWFKEKATQCDQIAQTIQTGLESIFFDDPVFRTPFRKYSVF